MRHHRNRRRPSPRRGPHAVQVSALLEERCLLSLFSTLQPSWPPGYLITPVGQAIIGEASNPGSSEPAALATSLPGRIQATEALFLVAEAVFTPPLPDGPILTAEVPGTEANLAIRSANSNDAGATLGLSPSLLETAVTAGVAAFAAAEGDHGPNLDVVSDLSFGLNSQSGSIAGFDAQADIGLGTAAGLGPGTGVDLPIESGSSVDLGVDAGNGISVELPVEIDAGLDISVGGDDGGIGIHVPVEIDTGIGIGVGGAGISVEVPGGVGGGSEGGSGQQGGADPGSVTPGTSGGGEGGGFVDVPTAPSIPADPGGSSPVSGIATEPALPGLPGGATGDEQASGATQDVGLGRASWWGEADDDASSDLSDLRSVSGTPATPTADRDELAQPGGSSEKASPSSLDGSDQPTISGGLESADDLLDGPLAQTGTSDESQPVDPETGAPGELASMDVSLLIDSLDHCLERIEELGGELISWLPSGGLLHVAVGLIIARYTADRILRRRPVAPTLAGPANGLYATTFPDLDDYFPWWLDD